MGKYKLPFRIGHHFASELVDYAKANNIKPSAFPYAEAKRIYAAAVEGYTTEPLPMSEEEFRATLDPVAIVKHRATVGGPQPTEMDRMLKAANNNLMQQNAWITEKRARIESSLAKLDHDFDKLLKTR
jgi:argininosuccinate lyase